MGLSSKANSFAGELDFDKMFGASSPKSPSPLLEYINRASVTFLMVCQH